MAKYILVLEDNDDRRNAMRQWLAERLSMYRLIVTDDPEEFLAYTQKVGPDVIAASLDHDLHERPDHSTTVTGMDVVAQLTKQPPSFPVLLHTSNVPDGDRMWSRLRKAGWSVTRVTPLGGTSWVGTDWYPALKRAIRSAARTEPVPPGDDRD